MKRFPSLAASTLLLAALGAASCSGPSASTGGPTEAATEVPTSTAAPTHTLEPTLPPEPTGWISYDSTAAGYWGIHLVRADGTGQPTPLTAHLNGEYWSSWSPDGATIAFASFRDSTGPDGTSSLYSIRPDGTGLTRLTDGTGSDGMPAWSPDGEQIAFTSDREPGNWDIYVVDSTGSGLIRLTDDPAADAWPSWSPDGRQIAFQSDRSGFMQIHVMRADGAGTEQLTQEEGSFPYLGVGAEPAEDGLAVIQVDEGTPAERAGLRAGDLIQAVDDVTLAQIEELAQIIGAHRPGDELSLSVVRDGSRLTLTATLGTAPQLSAYPTWSPDGTEIAFASFRDGDWDLYVMDADGGGPRPLTDNDFADLYPSWSPDGQFITFASDGEGNLDVYVMRADGSDITQLTEAPTDEYPPKWGPAQAAVGDEARFGPPFCARDPDGDGRADIAVGAFPQTDQSLFVSFPYANVSADLDWSLDLVMEDADTQSYTEPWGEHVAGILTVRFPNWIGYTIDAGGIHGAALGHYPPGTIAVRLTLGNQLVQEIECEIERR